MERIDPAREPDRHPSVRRAWVAWHWRSVQL